MMDKRNKPNPFDNSTKLLKDEIKEIEKFIKGQGRKKISLICNEREILEDWKSALSLLEAKQKEAEKHEEKLSK